MKSEIFLFKVATNFYFNYQTKYENKIKNFTAVIYYLEQKYSPA